MSALPLSFLAPLILLAAALPAVVHPGRSAGPLPLWSGRAALMALVLTGLGLVQAVAEGAPEAVAGPFGLRADPLSLTLAVLVAFIGWVVMRYSRTYLDGEAREGAFHGLMLATLAAVLVFVQAAGLWQMAAAAIAVGMGLRRLLLFYPDRPEARRAAAKFGLVWHAGGAALRLAAGLFAAAFGTADLGALAAAAVGAGLGPAGHAAVALVVAAALLKSAAFPLHGWLTEVMEAPTPVSALLHAGIINAGGVLLIAAAAVVQLSPGAMAALVMIGGFTALFGAAVMLTQSAVKTALAWSTVSQMGTVVSRDGTPIAFERTGVAADLSRVRGWLRRAGRIARAERAGTLPGATAATVAARALDWAQVRPEWGLAGCAAFIAAPRRVTAGRDLGGRAFLHSYDWRADDGFGTLELILTAPVVVASWISLQYYGSSVAPGLFGGGNKLIRNVVGGIGVVEGNGGRLRPGLPWQAVHDGEALAHEPLRLSVMIEAPRAEIAAVLERHPEVRALFDNGWLHLFALEDGRVAARYRPGLAWETPAAAPAA